MVQGMKETNKKDVIKNIAETYWQLYIDPEDPKAQDKYSRIVRMGEDPEKRTLDHFTGNSLDSDEYRDTPAGKIRVITLYERSDFVTFLKIMAHRCKPAEIPPTQGAIFLDGVINRRRIDAHREEFLKKSAEAGNHNPDWDSEFRRFTADKRNYTDTLIVLSYGPYSKVEASRLGFDDSSWLSYSHTIRSFHECTHFICRRLYPDKTDPVWDELVADAVGIYAAFGYFDLEMEALFLGITKTGYTYGRLENYVDREDYAGGEEYHDRLDELARESYITLLQIKSAFETHILNDPFDIIPILEESKADPT